MPTITETAVPVPETYAYTEAYLRDDSTIQLHVEDGESNAADPVYTVEQAEALHRALGHLLYLANQEA